MEGVAPDRGQPAGRKERFTVHDVQACVHEQ